MSNIREMPIERLIPGERLFVVPWCIYIERQTGQAWIAGDVDGIWPRPRGTCNVGIERTAAGIVAHVPVEARAQLRVEEAGALAWLRRTGVLLPVVKMVIYPMEPVPAHPMPRSALVSTQ